MCWDAIVEDVVDAIVLWRGRDVVPVGVDEDGRVRKALGL